MNIPPKEVRNSIYKIVLEILKLSHRGVFICNHLEWELQKTKYSHLLHDPDSSWEGGVLRCFPEFAKYQRKPPIPVEGGWWPESDKQSRTEALEECILSTN